MSESAGRTGPIGVRIRCLKSVSNDLGLSACDYPSIFEEADNSCHPPETSMSSAASRPVDRLNSMVSTFQSRALPLA